MTASSTQRIEGLRQAADAARGRLPQEVLDRADRAVELATQRLGLGGDHTVVALAGATGSGKSTTFNAIVGMEFSAVGVRRPTTSWTLSCVYGDDARAEGLLDWLGIPPRHRLSRESMLDPDPEDKEFEGMVLLDLPDHDSTAQAHREQMTHMIGLADVIVWVLDPQKYADAALHERFLRPLAGHKGSMLVVLNRIDEVPLEVRPAIIDDLLRLLRADGLGEVEVLATSAKQGEGMSDLKRAIADRVGARHEPAARFLTEVEEAAHEIAELTGDAAFAELGEQARTRLVDSFSDAAGLPVALRALEHGLRAEGGRKTGWPVARLGSRLGKDPLKQAASELGVDPVELTPQARLRRPEANQVQHARVETAVREVADEVTAGLTQPWAAAVRRASTSRLADLGPALDKAVAGIDLGLQRFPRWWLAATVVQWLGIVAVVGGLVGFAVTQNVWVLLVAAAGAVVGIGVALVARAVNRRLVVGRVSAAQEAARAAISAVAVEHVVDPIAGEVAALDRVRAGVSTALS